MKIVSTLISTFLLSSFIFAQNTEVNRPLKTINNASSFLNSDVAHQQSQNKSTQSQWVDYTTAYSGNYGSTPNGVIGNFLFPDSTILVNYGTGGYSGPWIHSVSQTFDMNAVAYTNTGIGINGANDISIDSIEIVGSYLRPDNSVVDTLVVRVVNVGANLSTESYFQGSTINTNLGSDSVFIRNIDWDQPTQTVVGPISTYKIPLDQAFFANTNLQGMHTAKIAANDLISSSTNGIFTITLDFKPGYTWNANLDTLGVNKNGWIFGSYELNGSNTYPNYNRNDYNVGSIVTDVVRYNTAGSWNGSYIPSYAFMSASPSFQYEAMAIAVKLTQHTPVNIADCSKPFFSEYIEGSSNNKALEIFNPTGVSIDLSNYEIRRYNNGASAPSSVTSLTGSVASNDVFVIANTQADQAILNQADMQSNNIIGYNGDDALELYDVVNAMVVDVIGVVGTDPGASWSVGSGSTANSTLIRMAGIKAGTDVWVGFVDQQWDVLANNDFSNIGMHTHNGCFAPQTPLEAIPTLSADTICEGGTIQFTNSSTGGTAPYTVQWNFGNGNTSTSNTDSFTYSTIGVYQISLNVTDNVGATDDSILYVVVNALPSSGMTIPNVACTGKDVVISASNYNAAYTYVYTDGSSTLSHSNGIVHYSNNNVGTYSISQTVTSTNGCTSAATETIVVNQSPVANFTFSGSPAVSFTDASTNAVAWNWSFGDGMTSSTQNPMHTYAGNGSFNASLMVTASNGCTDTTTNIVSVGVPSSIDEQNINIVSVYPNPIKNGVLNIVSQDEIYNVKVFNVLGQNVLSYSGNVQLLNLTGLVKGTYFVEIKTVNKVIVKKIIKE